MARIIPRGRNKWLVRVFLGRDAEGKQRFRNQTITGTKKDAQDWAHEAEPSKRLGTPLNLSVGDLLDDLVDDYRINGKRVDWCGMVAEKHLRPFFGSMSISKLDTPAVRRYIAERQAKGRANGTINRELALLRRAFNLGRINTPPKVNRVPFIPHLEENNVRKGFFEHGAYLSLGVELPESVRPVLTFGFYTGCRRGEILGLQWPQVDFMDRIIRLEPGTTKSGEARVIPLTGELYEVLKMQRAIRDEKYPDCPWVFFWHDTGKQIRDFRESWDKACQRAGLWGGDKKNGKPEKLFHDLRRTGVRNLIRAGVPEAVAMRISGHKTRSVFDRYNVVSEADLRDAARRLDSYLKQRGSARSCTIVTQGHQGGKRATRENPSKLLN